MFVGAAIFAAGSVLMYFSPPVPKVLGKLSPHPTRSATPSATPTTPKETKPSKPKPKKSQNADKRVPADSPAASTATPKRTPHTPKTSSTHAPAATPSSARPSPRPTKSTPTPAKTTAATTDPSLQADVVYLINRERSRAGLRSLSVNSALSAQSQAWAQTMASTSVLHHSKLKHDSEIIASGATTAQKALSLWLSSPANTRILLNPRWTVMGAGYRDGYWTVRFE